MPNTHTREFIKFCQDGKIETLQEFFVKRNWFTKYLFNLFSKKDYSSYQLELEYCAWFGLGMAAKSNDMDTVKYILNQPMLKKYFEYKNITSIYSVYGLFEPAPMLELIKTNNLKSKKYFVHICKNNDPQGPIFHYKEVKPIFVDEPILQAISNNNLDIFFEILNNTELAQVINIEKYIIKFLGLANEQSILSFKHIQDIDRIVNSNLHYALLETVDYCNKLASEYLIDEILTPASVMEEFQDYRLTDKQTRFLTEMNQQIRYRDMDIMLTKYPHKKDKKFIKI